MQQANLFRLQCSNPVGNYLKSPWSLVPLRGLRHQVKITNTWTSKGLSVENGEPLFWGNISNRVLSRRITTVSKKGKRKTCKAVAKRFIRTGKGKLKRWRCGKHHNQSKKRNRRKRFLRKPTYVSKTQLKTLNKMLNGWWIKQMEDCHFYLKDTRFSGKSGIFIADKYKTKISALYIMQNNRPINYFTNCITALCSILYWALIFIIMLEIPAWLLNCNTLLQPEVIKNILKQEMELFSENLISNTYPYTLRSKHALWYFTLANDRWYYLLKGGTLPLNELRIG